MDKMQSEHLIGTQITFDMFCAVKSSKVTESKRMYGENTKIPIYRVYMYTTVPCDGCMYIHVFKIQSNFLVSDNLFQECKTIKKLWDTNDGDDFMRTCIYRHSWMYIL